MKRQLLPGLIRIVTVSALASCLTGCLWDRGELLSDLNVSRMRAYNRWRSEAAEHEMSDAEVAR